MLPGMDSEVLHPAVGGGSVPVFDAFGNGNHRTGRQRNCGFVPFLIPAFSADTDEHLHGAVVDVPVIAAGGFERDVRHPTPIGLQIAVANEILRVGIIRFALRPNKRLSACAV